MNNYTNTQTRSDEVLNIRETLLRLASAKEIKYTQSYVKKASEKTLLVIFQDYLRDQLHKTNELFTDVFIGKFSELLQHLNLIENGTVLGRDLSDNEPFRQDVKFIVEYVTPYVPLIGLFSGSLIVGKHIISNTNKKEEECLVKESQEKMKQQEEKKIIS